MAYQAVDQKKEDFRKYLEKNGVVDALTKALVGLYEEPEKPDAPLDYLKHFISGTNDVDIAALKTENEELKKRVAVLETKLEESAANLKKLQDQQGISNDGTDSNEGAPVEGTPEAATA